MSKKKPMVSPEYANGEGSFEEQLTRLQLITQELEQGDLSLEKSLELYKEGVALSRRCRVLLEQARHTVQIYTEEGLAEFKLAEPDSEVMERR